MVALRISRDCQSLFIEFTHFSWKQENDTHAYTQFYPYSIHNLMRYFSSSLLLHQIQIEFNVFDCLWLWHFLAFSILLITCRCNLETKFSPLPVIFALLDLMFYVVRTANVCSADTTSIFMFLMLYCHNFFFSTLQGFSRYHILVFLPDSYVS